jgi:hypothetical protein
MSISFTDVYKTYITAFLNIFNFNNKILNINVISYDNLIMIYTNILSNNLHHSNKIIDNFIHNINFCVVTLDKKIKAFMPKYKNITLTEIQKLNNFNNLEFYKYYIGNYYNIFECNNKMYYATRYEINLLENNNLISNQDKFNLIHINSKYHNILCYDDDYSLITNKIVDINNNINFNSFEEFKNNFEELNKNDTLNKKITLGGFIIIINNKLYKINTQIYNELKSNLINTNINKCFLKLYQNNKLYSYVSYMTLYPSDIIHRINTSMKSISKELLNLYHITRNKNNSILYSKLTNNHKKILYELHTKFIEIRKNEYNLDDDMEIKKSITLATVYKYLKDLDIEYLIILYQERDEIINILQELNINNILTDCISTKTISYLLNK